MKQVLSRIIFMLITAIAISLMAFCLQAQTAPDSNELTKLLQEFLAGASRNDAAVHERFWADDVIYTGSAGRRRGKADIMRDVRSAPAPKPGDPTTVYTAEDIRIQQYGKAAVVAFRLVAATERSGRSEVTNYLNSGIFLKRHGKWQVVNWQSTRMPRSEEDAKREVAAAESAFHQAVLAADLKKLESLTDPSFIWTRRTGEQMTRRQLLDELGSGRLKYSTLETNNVVVSVYNDTGVVRGVSPRQRSSIPASPGSGDATPFNAFYTLTFVYKDGAWKAVAMHSSLP
jgi:ketosteroid isomerase-like protein